MGLLVSAETAGRYHLAKVREVGQCPVLRNGRPRVQEDRVDAFATLLDGEL